VKYFIIDPHADRGIRQLGEDNVRVLSNENLEYKLNKNDKPQIALADCWSNDWDKLLVKALDTLNVEITAQKNQLGKLEQSKDDLIESSPLLQRMVKQLKLF